MRGPKTTSLHKHSEVPPPPGPWLLNVISLENHLPGEYENLHVQQKNQYWSMTIGRDSFPALYSQLSPCEHPAITDTPIIRTTAKSPVKTNYSQLSSCEHPAITDTPIIRTTAKSPVKTNYSQLSSCEHPAITDTPIIRTAAKSRAINRLQSTLALGTPR